MTPATIIRGAQADGVSLTLSPAGTIKATGDGAAVNRWLAVIRERKVEIIEALKAGAGDTATASRWWLIDYPDRDPLEVAYCPEATHAEILERHPDAVAEEPFVPTIRQTSAPVTADEARAIRAWLKDVGETDGAIAADIVMRLAADPECLDFHLRRASAARIHWLIAKLERDPMLNYAIEPHEDVEPDAVLLTVAIRRKGACELRIPKSRYDAFALLDLIERHTRHETLQ